MSAPTHQKQIGSEQARTILAADFANIVRKVKEQKPLSARQREVVEKVAGEMDEAKTIKDLVALVGMPRSIYYRLRKTEGAPPGLSVAEWREFYAKHKAIGSGKLSTEEIVQLKGRLLEERTKREAAERKLKEIRLKREEEGWVSMKAAEEVITRILEPVNRLLEGIPKAFSTMVNPTDPDFAEEMLREMVEDLKRQIQSTRGEKISKRKGVK